MKFNSAVLLVLLHCTSLIIAQEPGEQQRAAPTTRTGPTSRPLPSAQSLPRAGGKLISFDIVIAEMAAPQSPMTAVSILELQKAGKLSSVLGFQLTTLEEQSSFVQVGELAPRITGRIVTGARGGFPGGPGGPGAASMPSYTDINIGTMAQVTARLEDDGSVLAQLYIECSTMPPPARDPAGQEPPPSVMRLLSQTTVRLKPGQPTIVSARQAQNEKDTVQSWTIVTANVPGNK